MSEGEIRTPEGGVRIKVQGSGGRAEYLSFPDLTPAEAVRRAAALGLRVLAVDELYPVRIATHTKRPFPLILFSQELLALLEAGLNLIEALTTLAAKERQPQARHTLEQVLQSLREGRAFSDVLEQNPAAFPDIYVATVRASERTGDLPQAIARYIAYQLQFEAIRKKIVSVSIYPLMLMTVGLFVTLFLLGYVVPKFSAVYESAGRDMPLLSMWMLKAGKAIHQNWQVGLLLLCGCAALLTWCLVQSTWRRRIIDVVLGLPVIEARVAEFRMARFFRAASLLLVSGVALPRALGMVSGLLSPAQRARMADARLAVEQGQAFSGALIAQGLASPVAESLIKVGERSGQLAEMLERTARFYDEDFSRWVDWGSRLLEPVLMAVIGVVIGTVVVLMYMPIFDLAGSLQ